MAPGWLAKIGNFFKKVGTGIVKGFRKVKEVGAKMLSKAAPIIENIPVVGTAYKFLKPGIDYVAENGGRTQISPLDPIIDKYLLKEQPQAD